MGWNNDYASDGDLRTALNGVYQRIGWLEDELKQTQAALVQVLAALERVGQPVDVRVGSAPPTYLQNWKMKPIDDE